MRLTSKAVWIITFLSIFVFILTFFIFFRETQQTLSSLTAAALSAFLFIGAIVTLYWLTKALKT